MLFMLVNTNTDNQFSAMTYSTTLSTNEYSQLSAHLHCSNCKFWRQTDKGLVLVSVWIFNPGDREGLLKLAACIP